MSMFEDILKAIVTSDYNSNFVINGTLLHGSTIYTDIEEPARFIMLCRQSTSNMFCIRKFNRNYREVSCIYFNNLSDFLKNIKVENLRYNRIMNYEVLEELNKVKLG